MQIITGNSFKSVANYLFVDGVNIVGPIYDREDFNIFFVKTDYIYSFFKKFGDLIFSKPFKVITHNSDYGIGEECKIFLDHESLLSWFAQNVLFEHRKLHPIPIGIANEEWLHGDTSVLNRVIDESKAVEKKEQVYYNFSNWTNPRERNECSFFAEKVGLVRAEHKNFYGYLSDLSKNMFCLSPDGNGVDCHKVWECLYLGVVPVVKRSITTEFFSQLYPMIVLNSWKDLDIHSFDSGLYKEKSKLFNEERLSFTYYAKSILHT